MFEDIFEALNAAGVRYVLVGGLAVVLRGYVRATGDVDLVVDLDAVEARKAVDALLGLGYRPHAPVDARLFADTKARQTWIEEKGLRVFSMFDPRKPLASVDLFVEEPLPFADLLARSDSMSLGRTSVRVAAISDLITKKRAAGRTQDVADIEMLELIRRHQENADE